MFHFLKRLVSPEPQPEARPKPRPRKPAGKSAGTPEFEDTTPLVEVTEGNEHSDWELWEDSVVSLDSRMQGLMPSSKIYDDPERASEYQDLDAFSKVRRNDP